MKTTPSKIYRIHFHHQEMWYRGNRHFDVVDILTSKKSNHHFFYWWLIGKKTRRTRLECLKIILDFGRDSKTLITDCPGNYRWIGHPRTWFYYVPLARSLHMVPSKLQISGITQSIITTILPKTSFFHHFQKSLRKLGKNVLELILFLKKVGHKVKSPLIFFTILDQFCELYRLV